MAYEKNANFRLRIARDILRILIAPPLALSLVAHIARIRMGWWSPLAYVSSIVFAAIARVQYTDMAQQREAKQLGARLIPRVVGKWPGNIDVMLKLQKSLSSGYIYQGYLELFEEYQCTTLNTRFLWMDNIISMDQEHCKYVLATGFNNFWRGTAQRERLETFLGDGIFNRDDEHRTLARPFFARDRVSDFELFERYTTRTFTILSEKAALNEPIDVQDLYARFTIDAASEFLFGKNLDTLSGSLPRPSSSSPFERGSVTDDAWGTFTRAFETLQRINTLRARTGLIWPLFELFDDKTVPYVDTVRQWIDPLVKRTLEEKAAAKRAGVERNVEEKTFLQHLADSTEAQTACLLTYVTYFLALHPDVAKKLRQEVAHICGDQPPTYEKIKKLKYMKAVIDETLRLFPPVPLNQRQSRPVPCTLPAPDPTFPVGSQRPLYMPKSTTFFYSTLLVQRNKALWGPDADEFDPERWIDPKRLSRYTSNPTMFTPFSAGPRICIGQNYAYNEASYFLVRLMQHFSSFTLAPDAQPPSSLPPAEWKAGRGRMAIERIRPEAAMTLFVKGGLWVRLGRVASSEEA
ncbi:cytochrome P450 monooxygenase CYP63 [Pisolithus orientalis]|uniref:cytochrome P450 monooxygenase CYP63 n=1 Tax=Pisolithus orientalis TaxID=936130 RepID=UPI00222456D1|nr:cytochrome P450 monooxygenase CYP63 [Pisolithus orientalis]KAI6015338.1 cytochrome P450 monooxygenase CYP63 [Pisolithus orientalis]